MYFPLRSEIGADIASETSWNLPFQMRCLFANKSIYSMFTTQYLCLQESIIHAFKISVVLQALGWFNINGDF